jgi:hypothetical protein
MAKIDGLKELGAVLLFAPIGLAATLARSGLTLLEAVVHASERMHHAWELHRDVASELARELELAQALADKYRLEARALRVDVTRLQLACEGGDWALADARAQLVAAERDLAKLRLIANAADALARGFGGNS